MNFCYRYTDKSYRRFSPLFANCCLFRFSQARERAYRYEIPSSPISGLLQDPDRSSPCRKVPVSHLSVCLTVITSDFLGTHSNRKKFLYRMTHACVFKFKNKNKILKQGCGAGAKTLFGQAGAVSWSQTYGSGSNLKRCI